MNIAYIRCPTFDTPHMNMFCDLMRINSALCLLIATKNVQNQFALFEFTAFNTAIYLELLQTINCAVLK
jgi:hypothetical protein